LTLIGTTASLAAVTTTGAQNYTGVTTTTLNGTLTVNTAGAGVSAGNVTIAAGGGGITLTGTNAANNVTLGTVTGAAQILTINTGSATAGTISLGAVGSSGNSLTSLSVTGATATLGGSVFANSQTYNAAVSVGGGANLVVAGGGQLTFGSTLTLTSAATLTADGFNFNGGAGSVHGGGFALTLTPATAARPSWWAAPRLPAWAY
jgi:outer membrane translocation and assembly module TamA